MLRHITVYEAGPLGVKTLMHPHPHSQDKATLFSCGVLECQCSAQKQLRDHPMYATDLATFVNNRKRYKNHSSHQQKL